MSYYGTSFVAVAFVVAFGQTFEALSSVGIFVYCSPVPVIVLVAPLTQAGHCMNDCPCHRLHGLLDDPYVFEGIEP